MQFQGIPGGIIELIQQDKKQVRKLFLLLIRPYNNSYNPNKLH